MLATRRKLLAPFALAILFAQPCAMVTAASARTVAYSCADGSLVVASFEPRTGRVLLTVGTWRVLLPAARAASGARYSNGKITFWTKGDEARLVRGGRELVCRAEKGD